MSEVMWIAMSRLRQAQRDCPRLEVCKRYSVAWHFPLLSGGAARAAIPEAHTGSAAAPPLSGYPMQEWCRIWLARRIFANHRNVFTEC